MKVIGNGSVAQAQLTHGQKGDYFAINWGWALGCMLGILVSANVSGNCPFTLVVFTCLEFIIQTSKKQDQS